MLRYWAADGRLPLRSSREVTRYTLKGHSALLFSEQKYQRANRVIHNWSGSVVDPGPDSLESLDPDPDYESGSRRAKMTPKNRKKVNKFHFQLYQQVKAMLRNRIRIPGSGAFFTPGSGIRDGKKSRSGSGMNIPDHISESLETTFFGLKYFNSLMRIRDPV
jgi:hypothetical protein